MKSNLKSYLQITLLLMLSCISVSHANATLIKTVVGDKGSILTWTRIDARTLQYSIDSTSASDNYLFSEVLTPFLSDADRNLVTVDAGSDWDCLTNQNYSICILLSTIDSNGIRISNFTDTFLALFSLPQEYVFGDLVANRNITATAASIDFEQFSSTFIPQIFLASEAPTPELNSPGMIGVFGLALAGFLFRLRKNKLR